MSTVIEVSDYSTICLDLYKGRIEERPHSRFAYGRPLSLALGRSLDPKASQLENFGPYGRAT
jgi:hypothetical protein